MPGPGRPFQKGDPNLGRKPGSKNKRTLEVREVLLAAAREIGGKKRLIEWVKKSAVNERLFWSVMFLRLLPTQILGTGPRGELELEIKPENLERELQARGLPTEIFGRDIPVLDLTPEEDDPNPPQRH